MSGTSDGRRRKRLSADLPQHWLLDPTYRRLPDEAWRLLTHSLMWAIGQTDGFIPEDMLPALMDGSPEERQRAVRRLSRAGIWARAPGGWQFAEWEASQSTVAEIENRRSRDREKKQKQRANVPRGNPPGNPRGEHGTARKGKELRTTTTDVHSRESEREP
jgi:hypothetical protein